LLLLALGRLQLLATQNEFQQVGVNMSNTTLESLTDVWGYCWAGRLVAVTVGMNDTLYRSDHFQEDEYWSSNKSSKITKVFQNDQNGQEGHQNEMARGR
jgi:hypothetical protein